MWNPYLFKIFMNCNVYRDMYLFAKYNFKSRKIIVFCGCLTKFQSEKIEQLTILRDHSSVIILKTIDAISK